ncbi:sialic acid O-acetyltransferase [uncultured Sanguibacteroides sp.]|uniref:sialic acid O-acetyltransferase n=1 Tax=uncultured Sanguibacteroides sp. TaxID=1635151 RepID=UPI0025CD6119|nr:sialic acid O-acetyltransferase [uncultured Sanguibacteroides sp.]
MKNLIIIGIGNFSKIVEEYARKSTAYNKEWVIKGYLKSEFDKLNDTPTLASTVEEYVIETEDVFICSYVNGQEREIVTQKIEAKGGHFINIIHPLANICSSVKLGKGNIVGAFTTLSVNTTIGNHTIVQDHCNVGHDSVIGNYSHLYVGTLVSGKNSIGNGVSVFTGSVIYPGLQIGNKATVGAGSVVMRKVKDNSTVLGNPAKTMD